MNAATGVSFRGQDVLVTGAGGFCGSHLALALARRGHRVTAVTGRTAGRLGMPGGLPANLRTVCGDLADELPLPEPLDAVIHAAARSAWPGVTVEEMVRGNVIAMAHLLRHARAAGARRFVFLSSLSVHGSIDADIVDEGTPIVDPDAYGLTKRLGEQMLAECDGMASLSLRLPGVLGAGSVRNWLTTVLAALRAGQDVAVSNPDSPFNNAVHIGDLCDFVASLLQHDWTGADIVTMGAAGHTNVRGAVEALRRASRSGSAIRIVPAARRPFTLSIERARAVYGYAPMEIGAMLERFAQENPP